MPQNETLLVLSPAGCRAEFFVDAADWNSARSTLLQGRAVQLSGYIRPAGSTVGGSSFSVELLGVASAGPQHFRAGIVEGQAMEALPGDEVEIVQS